MLRLLLLLVGAQELKSRWVLLVVLSLAWTSAGAAMLMDIASDGTLTLPLYILTCVLLIEGVVELLTALIAPRPLSRMNLARSGFFIAIALLVFGYSGDNNLLSLIFAAALLLDGLFRIISTCLIRCRLYGKKVTFGLLQLLLSLLIFCNWPYHHHIVIAGCFAAMMMNSGLSLFKFALQVWRLPANTSVTTLPLFTSRGLRRPHGTAYVHPPFPHAEPEVAMQVLVWTPVGSATVKERRIVVDRYLAAIDVERNISTGHTALELPDRLYISHYPLEDIDRDFSQFRLMVRAGEEYDVAGRFLDSLKQEIDEWCAPDRRLALHHYNAEALRNYWQTYSSDTRYNLTSRNCSTTVIQVLDVAIEGALSAHGVGVFGLLINPNFWLLWLVRSRAEGMTWTPGLLMDYVCLLQKVLQPAPCRSWHKRMNNALAQRRHSLMELHLNRKGVRPRRSLL
ncbi:membrane protein [Erwinia tasmaniensis]|uniref:membrane protein n=1 Tax=Erwinia tasmaniensis TaxID=338565 RepID=UPI0005B43931|nr:membrane protein [Erwinia tasmaniensis]